MIIRAGVPTGNQRSFPDHGRLRYSRCQLTLRLAGTTNGLLGSYRGVLGIKTGNTNAADNCLLFQARRGRHTLIGVVLHVNPTSSPNTLFNAARQLLNWGIHRI